MLFLGHLHGRYAGIDLYACKLRRLILATHHYTTNNSVLRISPIIIFPEAF
jgi:hypothetical protein